MTDQSTPEWSVETPIETPIEIRLHNPRLGSHTVCIVAWVGEHGIIGYYVTYGGTGIPRGLTDIQAARDMIWPGKAVPGWQAEAIAYAESGLYQIVEIR